MQREWAGAGRAVAWTAAALWVLGTGAPNARGAGLPELAYRFELLRAPGLQVRVALVSTGSPGPETSFEVSRNWGGVATGGEDLADVTARGARGRELVVQHPEPHRWRVQHAPGESLVVSYAFHPNTYQDDPSPDTHRRPILNDHLFHVYSEVALLRPGHLDAGTRARITFEWFGFEAAGWQVATSFAVGAGRHQVEASLGAWREAVFMAGDFELLRREVEGRPVYVGLAGREWGFHGDEFADLVQRVVALERGFFADFDYPFFLVTAIPVGRAKSGSRSLGGTGLTNSFSLSMLPDTALGGGAAPGMEVQWLLAHEMFHNWCGHRVVPADPEQLAYWFSEGFTDFYTRRLLLRGGLITRDEYVQGLNTKIADLLGSPVAVAPNERIRADFWKNPAVKRLPYLRGDLVAVIADGAIRRASNGKQSLDDLMRAMVAEAGSAQLRVDTRMLLRRIEELAGETTAAHLQRVVVNGVLPEIDARTYEPCLELRVVPLGNFDLGFDFETSRSKRRITGVVAGSRAQAAGLRDGQEILGWSVHWGDAQQPVQCTVADYEGQRDITWLPVGTEKPTPQFFVRQNARGADCDCL